VLTFPDHQNGVYGVAVRADGKVGLSVGEDGQLRAWNSTGEQGGKQVRNAAQGKATFKVVVVPQKQPIVVTCDADRAVRVSQAEDLKVVKTFKGHTDYVYALAVSPDNDLIASGSFNGEVKVWKLSADKASGEKAYRSFNASPGFHGAAAAAK
jgi:WD40 repeat protein